MNQRLRTKIYERDNYQCCNCKKNKKLIVHHIYPQGRGGKDTKNNLITLCSKCHEMVHQANNITIGFWIKHFKLMIKEINLKVPEKDTKQKNLDRFL